MKSRWEALRFAFAVDPEGPAEPREDEAAAVEWFCEQVARRHLSTPGLIALEMARPLNFLAAQMMQVLAPGVWAVAPRGVREHYDAFARFLERRGATEYLAARIEVLEGEFAARQAARSGGGGSTGAPGASKATGDGPAEREGGDAVAAAPERQRRADPDDAESNP